MQEKFNKGAEVLGVLPTIAAFMVENDISVNLLRTNISHEDKVKVLRFRRNGTKLYEMFVIPGHNVLVLQEFGHSDEDPDNGELYKHVTGIELMYTLMLDAIELAKGNILPINISNKEYA